MKNNVKSPVAVLSFSFLLALAGVGCVVVPSIDDGDVEITDDPDAACLEFCEERNATCGGSNDCQLQCELRSDMDCNDEGDAYDDCAAESEDICVVDGCQAEADAVVACVMDYCAAHPGEGLCPSE